MKINEVIERHGMQLRDVSREMGMKPSALQSAIDRNLTVKTLRLISEAAKIPIAEFFLDELTDEERQQLLAALNPSQPAAESVSAEQQQAASAQTDGQQPEQEELPFGQQQPSQEQQPQDTTLVGLVRCPQCGRAIRLFAEE